MAFDDGKKTVSGSIAHTDDAATKVPFVSVKCGIEPTLSGVSSVTETQTGRNLFDKTTATIGKYINVSGQEATNGIKAHSVLLPLKPSTSYYMSGYAYNSYYSILALDKDMNVLSTWYGGASKTEPFVATTPNNARWCYLNFNADQIDDVIFAESTTAIPYEAYNGTQYTASLGRTIYGGQADIVNGVGTDGYALFTKNTADMNNSESYPGWKNQGVRAICGGGLNQEYADGVTSEGNGFGINTLGNSNDILYLPKSMHNNMTQTDWIALAIDITFVIPLSTPTDFTFTPVSPTPETVGKVNNVYCNTGETEVTYYDNAHGFAEVTVNKNGVSQTAYLHKVIYGGTADVVKGTCEPKNLIPFEPISEYTYLGITYTQYSDGTVKINGTASGGLSFYRVIPNGSDGVHFKSGVAYTLSGCVGGSSTTYQLDLRVGNSVAGYYKNAIDYGRGYTFTATEDSVAYPLICVRNGTTVNNVIISPMVEVGFSVSEYAPYFEPFSFPPISISTDEGENTLFANEGDSAITYRKAVD